MAFGDKGREVIPKWIFWHLDEPKAGVKVQLNVIKSLAKSWIKRVYASKLNVWSTTLGQVIRLMNELFLKTKKYEIVNNINT